ncbi:Hypothetical predicted protein [Lecanosticta acicola]|uniref:Uncharacterized protein n=1 Tax=Lecanosticta acicola TaxID=111012 RepID=A0AAI9E8S5_9PEZI|nr:Hypothetical predicted protein [Lecanosticta acicola]
MGFMEKLRAKYDIYKLQQRYTRREKRTTFISDARYVDGEYVYNTSPMRTGGSNSSFGSDGKPSMDVNGPGDVMERNTGACDKLRSGRRWQLEDETGVFRMAKEAVSSTASKLVCDETFQISP